MVDGDRPLDGGNFRGKVMSGRAPKGASEMSVMFHFLGLVAVTWGYSFCENSLSCKFII